MNIIVNNTSMQPIYEQIEEQIKGMIMQGTMKQEEMLPSVRSLSKDLRISALTVKKAYDTLEQEGFVITVHGKGSFVAGVNQNLLLEEQKKEVERDMEAAIRKGKSCGMEDEELRQLFDLLKDMRFRLNNETISDTMDYLMTKFNVYNYYLLTAL